MDTTTVITLILLGCALVVLVAVLRWAYRAFDRFQRRLQRGQVSWATKVVLTLAFKLWDWLRTEWRERVALREAELDDERLHRNVAEERKGTIFYLLEGWWETKAGGDHTLLAYKFGITTNLEARVAQICTSTPLKVVVVLTLPYGEAFEQHLLHLTRHARTTGVGEEWRRADDATTRDIVDKLRELSRGREVSFSDA